MTMQEDTKTRALTQLQIMLDLQNAMNTKVHSSWYEQGYDWYRAIWVECAEMLDHFGWKWWKHQECDLDQVKLELVDIFHFGLSLYLQDNRVSKEQSQDSLSAQCAEEILSKILDESPVAIEFPVALEQLAATALNEKAFDVAAFQACLQAIDFPLDELYRMYIGKNTLNFFRQDHGYKDGSYHKTWQGREDNEHLAEIISTLDSSDTNFPKNVYQALETRYPSAESN